MPNKEFLTKSLREIAHELESLNRDEIVSFLTTSTKSVAQNVFFELSQYIIVDIFPLIEDELFVKIFAKADTHKSARVLSSLNRNDVDKKLELLPRLTSREIKGLLEYDENTAGFIMESLLVTFSKEETVELAVEKLRKIGDKKILTIYIVDDEKKLIGRVPVNYLAVRS